MNNNIYDILSYNLTINLYSLNKDKNTIDLFGLDLKNKGHQWFLENAIIASSIFGKRIRTDNNFFTRLSISLKNLKKVHFIKKIKRDFENNGDKTIDEILEFMRPSAIELSKDKNFTFDSILSYYKEVESEV